MARGGNGGREKDTDYEPSKLLTRHELKKFDPRRKDHIAVLEARQQERERRTAAGIPVPHKEDDLPPSRHRPR